LLTRRSDRIATGLIARQPRWLSDWQGYYHGWLERLSARSKRNLFWQLTRKRLFQISAGLLFVSGLIVFSRDLFALTVSWLGPDWLFPNGPAVIFWTLLVLAILTPMVAIWRNISAMAMLYAEMTTRGNERSRRFQPIVELGLKAAAAALLYLWLMSILPAEGTARWLLMLSAAIAAVAVLVLRRRMIYWHSELEVGVMGMISAEARSMTATSAPWLQSHDDWSINVAECVIPDLADCQGKSIKTLRLRSRFGCTVVGIERHGYMVPLPGPETVLFARDKVLLMGNPEQVAQGRRFLGTVSGTPIVNSDFEEVCMEALIVPAGSPAAGCTLAELAPAQKYGVLVAGLHRGGSRILNPDAGEKVGAGDEILALGTPEQIRNFRSWLAETAAE
jgi:CPA2 family monovalent cation:H+ antiporter-2